MHSIKQRINEPSIPPTVYSEYDKEEKSCLCIAHENGKYGIITETGDLFLPFEYDNISMAGFSMYLLIQKGKMGLLHVMRPILDEIKPFEILKIIPCEYDIITFPGNGTSFVFLRKDEEKKSSIQVYFTKTNTISEPQYRIDYVDQTYVVVTGTDRCVHKAFDENGKFIYSDDEPGIGYNVYETINGTVFINEISEDSVLFVFAERKKKAEFENFFDDDDYYYELTGEVKKFYFNKFVRPILASEHIRTFERDFALGFIVGCDGGFQVLDGRCERLSEDSFPNLSISTKLSSRPGKGKYTEIPLKKANSILINY